jgi:hypothetical protein
MIQHATVTYSREILRKAVKHFWLRFIAWHGFAALGLCCLCFSVLLLTGDRS